MSRTPKHGQRDSAQPARLTVPRPASRRRPSAWMRLRARGFTLIEMLTALTVFALMLGFFLVLAGGAQRAWTHSENKVELYQNGRAVLELISRELSPAVVSSRYQLVQTPDLSQQVTGPAPYLPATNSPSLFWIAPNPASGQEGLCEIGYFLTQYGASNSYALNRFAVAQDNTNGYYQFSGTKGLATNSVLTAQWIAQTPKAAFSQAEKNPAGAVTTVAEGVVAMWIRCFDTADNPIPWLCQDEFYYTAAPMQFNSAAAFQMTSGTATPFSDGSTFQYTAAPPATVAANRLPESVEITLIMVDSRTLARNPAIPQMPSPPADPKDVPAQIEAFNTALIQAGVTTARTFSARIRLLNASTF